MRSARFFSAASKLFHSAPDRVQMIWSHHWATKRQMRAREASALEAGIAPFAYSRAGANERRRRRATAPTFCSMYRSRIALDFDMNPDISSAHPGVSRW